MAWNAALLRPDRVCAVVGMSVPVRPRAPMPPTVNLRRLFGDDYYQLRFQQPAVAERELGPDLRASLRTLMYAASRDAPPEHRWNPTTGGPFLAGLVDPVPRLRASARNISTS